MIEKERTFDKVMNALDCCIMDDPDDKRDCRHCPMCNYGAFVTTSCVNGLLVSVRSILKTFASMKDCRLCVNSEKCDPGSPDGETWQFFVDCMKHQKKNWRFDDDAARNY